MSWRAIVTLGVIAAAAGTASANLLLNASFESGSGQGQYMNPGSTVISNWTFWGGGWWANDPGYVRSGTWAIKRWDNGTGIYQDFPATPNEIYIFSVWGNDGSAEPLANRWVDLKVEWFDAGHNMLQQQTIGQLLPGGPYNTWREVSGLATAANNTAYGRFLITTEGQAGASGSVYYDDASVMVIPEPTVLALSGLGAAFLVHLRKRRKA